MMKPSLFRRTVLWIVDSWRVVMDTRYNPLRFIPDPSLQTYFMLVLFTIWSVTFGFIATYYLGWYGYDTVASIIIHAAILIPLAFTNAIFLDAERDGHKWLAEWREEQSKYKFFLRRAANIVRWDLDKEA